MSLSPAFLDELRARTTLSTLIRKTVKLTKAGNEFKGCCPFHNEKTPSFYVNDAKAFYHCFGCSAHGDAIRWMTDQRGLPFIDAVKELAATAGMEMPAMDRQSVEKAERAKGLHEVMSDAADWFSKELAGISGGEARALIQRRGLKPETVQSFGLGFAPDSRGKLRGALKTYGDQMLIDAGLLISVEDKEPYDRFRGRLMIPIRDPRGRVIAFGGRVVGDGEPKYLNSPDTPLFDKGRTLYNLDKAAPAARKAGRVIAVEGYMDVIALAEAGIAEAVAPLGTALTESQLDRLWQMVDVPILCFDGDDAGQKAAVRAGKRALPGLLPGRSVSFATMPKGLDPDDVVRTKGAAAFDALLAEATPLVERLWSHELAAQPILTPESRAGLGARLRAHAKEIRDDDVRTDYLATFNRMVWDHFHPERPSDTFKRFGKAAPKRPIAPRLVAISQHGIDQVTMIPAVMKGLILFPDLIAPLAETLVQLPINSIKLRQTREVMFDSALKISGLETEQLRTILKDEGRGDVLAQMEGITLAFSFLSQQGDKAQAKRDLALALEALVTRPQLEADIEEARSRGNAWSDQDFENFALLVKAKQEVEQLFSDALLQDEESPVA